MCFQHLKEGIVIEKRWRERTWGEEEPAHLAIEFVGGVLVEFHRENRLRKVHFKVGIQNGVGHCVRQIVAIVVPSTDEDILRDRPTAVTDIVKDEEVTEERLGFFSRKVASVRLKDTVGIAEGEGVGVGRLFKTHHLPQEKIKLHCLVQRSCLA